MKKWRQPIHTAGRFSGVLCACLAAAVVMAHPAFADVTSVSAGGYGESIQNVTVLGLVGLTSGPLPQVSFENPPNGPGPFTTSLASVSVPTAPLLGVAPGAVLTAGLLQVTTQQTGTLGTHQAGSTSAVDVANVNALGGRVTADAVHSQCSATGSGVSGSTTLINANVLGIGPITANPDVNQTVTFDNLLRVVFNEQNVNRSGQTNQITVNAIHIYILPGLGSGDIIIGHVQCGATGPDVVIPVGTIGGIGLASMLGVAFVAMQVRKNRASRRNAALVAPPAA